MANNDDRFARGGAQPGGLGEASRRVKEDLASGAQARVTEEEVERQRERLADVAGDGAGAVGAAEDGRSTRAPEGENETAGKRGVPSTEDDRQRRLDDAYRNEQDRLTRR